MAFKNRLLLFTLIWFLCSAALLTALSVSVWQQNEWRSRQVLHKDLAVHMRDDNPLMVGGDYSPEALSSIFHTLMLLGPDFEIYFLDPQGNITTSGPPKEDVIRLRVDVEPIEQFLRGEPFPVLGEDPLSESGEKVFSVARIDMDGQVAGYLYVLIGSQGYNVFADLDSLLQYAPVVAAALVAILLFALVVYRMVYRRIIIPGRVMVGQIEQSAKTEFRISPPLKVRSPELQELATQYRRMMAVIQQQFIQLRVQEAQRREYMVQLSHDLKTPLANILGYLETWRIQHKEGRGMIDTAYHNAQRLQTHLKSQLEAARSPSAKIVLSYRDIDVRELFEDVRHRFELQLKKKQVDLVVTVSEPLTVIADEVLINRVFDNVMENAIRHSPARSSILMDANRAKGGSVSFCIENAVDEFSDEGSLGIGSKIVDAILSLHQSQLEVSSPRSKEELRYRVCFALSSIAAQSSARLRSVPMTMNFEDDTPPIDSGYPKLRAESEAGKESAGNEEINFSTEEQTTSQMPLPSFRAVVMEEEETSPTENNKAD
ncbi:sensor histidine kinase [Grimontia sp. NTOU-MAR1]|uniref:sensor histidine kinase n=1 Tax=Grimontia sp. NTOU-MAR1 TaxID=3111011 RepID=UPI002DBAEC43|nr:histidine kinase dimerization/phospho-acceptor domain-containing protein [Grimontia sp. NTOU-MAR1]WRW00362.1 histidine kinase dimerization/phospho-acceptor domain-containing protein [Grimontia sp. NTOU-MAR1]